MQSLVVFKNFNLNLTVIYKLSLVSILISSNAELFWLTYNSCLSVNGSFVIFRNSSKR